MICKNCGATLTDDAIFCFRCGTKQEEDSKNTFEQVQGLNHFEPITEELNSKQEQIEPSETDENTGFLSENTGAFFENQNAARVVSPEQSFEEFDRQNLGNMNPAMNQPVQDVNMHNEFQAQMPNGVQPNNYTVPQNGAMEQPVKTSKVKKVFFSFFVFAATIATIAMLFMDYTSFEVKNDSGDRVKKEFLGYGIFTIQVEDELTETNAIEYIDDSADEIKSEIKTPARNYKRITMVTMIVVIATALLDLIFVLFVRKKVGYVFTMLFSLAKGGLLGYSFFLWNTTLYNKYADAIKAIATEKTVINWSIGLGFIVMAALQVVIFISSIILLTCKNKKKTV